MRAKGAELVEPETDLLPPLDRRRDGAVAQRVTPHAHADPYRSRYFATSASTVSWEASGTICLKAQSKGGPTYRETSSAERLR